MPQIRGRRNRGYALITTAACSFTMIAMLGLCVDVGRMYIVKNEAQAYADSAAMAAALELDGANTGLARARSAVAASLNRWHLGNTVFTGTVTEFATSKAGPWAANPASPAGMLFVRVSATAAPPLYFMPVVVNQRTATVNASAVAAQVPEPRPREGSFPFSPMSHDEFATYWGLSPGTRYTLRWASNPKLNANTCDGDNNQTYIDRANTTGDERGYIEDTSSSIIRLAIEGDYQTRPLSVGDTVFLTGGSKQTQQDSIVNRIRQDTDAVSKSYLEYRTLQDAGGSGAGNGRRLIVVPINTWSPEDRVVGFATFFLLAPEEYLSANGGNKPFCAEFVGAARVQGSTHQGAGGTGSFVVRLVL